MSESKKQFHALSKKVLVFTLLALVVDATQWAKSPKSSL